MINLINSDGFVIAMGLIFCCLIAFLYIKIGLVTYDGLSQKTKDMLKGRF